MISEIKIKIGKVEKGIVTTKNPFYVLKGQRNIPVQILETWKTE